MVEFNVSNTMKVLKNKNLKGEYIVIRIGNETYSTSFGEIKTGKDIDRCALQKVDTVGIGIQDNVWVKGTLTEGTNHKPLSEGTALLNVSSDGKIPFEINIYTSQGDIENPEGSKNTFNPNDYDKNVCESCGEGHLYCESCKKYTWKKEGGIDG